MANETAAASKSPVVLFLAWLVVGAPLLWGVFQTLMKASQLFK